MRANHAGLKNLARPGGLGDFKILFQGKNIEIQELWGLQGFSETTALVDELRVPLLTDLHISLPNGQFLGGETEFEAFWPFTDSEPTSGSETPETG